MFALVCSVLFLGPSAQAMRGESQSSSTIRLVSTVTRNGLTIDSAPRHAASKGDVVWFRSVLRNQVAQFGRPAAAIVGREYAVFTFLTDRTARVNVTVWLPGGTLRTPAEKKTSPVPCIPRRSLVAPARSQVRGVRVCPAMRRAATRSACIGFGFPSSVQPARLFALRARRMTISASAAASTTTCTTRVGRRRARGRGTAQPYVIGRQPDQP